MKLRTRRIFFWALIPCFLVGGAAAVLYSQGYRVDAHTSSVTKVGALFVRGFPRSARITLDGEPLDTGSWWPLQSGTFVASLVPGTYRLRAEAPGYRTWEADMAVHPALVTERKSLVLFPEESLPVAVTSSLTAAGIRVADDGLVVTGVNASGTLMTLAADARMPGAYLGTAAGRVITAAPIGATSTLLRFQAPGGEATTITVQGAALALEDGSAVVRAADGLIVAYDIRTARRTVVASSTARIGIVLRTGSYDAWTEESATSSALLVRRGASGMAQAVPIPRATALQPAGSSLGVLDENGSLWLVDPDDGSYREVGHRAGFASWAADGSSVAAMVDGTLEVIPLRTGAPSGRMRGILGAGTEVRRIEWYPGDEHLFVETGDSLVFADVIDGVAGEQHAYRLPRPQDWTFSPEDLTLYVLDSAGAITAYAFPD